MCARRREDALQSMAMRRCAHMCMGGMCVRGIGHRACMWIPTVLCVWVHTHHGVVHARVGHRALCVSRAMYVTGRCDDCNTKRTKPAPDKHCAASCDMRACMGHANGQNYVHPRGLVKLLQRDGHRRTEHSTSSPGRAPLPRGRATQPMKRHSSDGSVAASCGSAALLDRAVLCQRRCGA